MADQTEERSRIRTEFGWPDVGDNYDDHENMERAIDRAIQTEDSAGMIYVSVFECGSTGAVKQYSYPGPRYEMHSLGERSG